jgi:hypothetical protein
MRPFNAGRSVDCLQGLLQRRLASGWSVIAFAPRNDRARWCIKRTGLLRGAGMVMPQRPRSPSIPLWVMASYLNGGWQAGSGRGQRWHLAGHEGDELLVGTNNFAHFGSSYFQAEFSPGDLWICLPHSVQWQSR